MNMTRLITASFLISSMVFGVSSAAADVNITGAGATFPAPVYTQWADIYYKENNKKINYQGIGSSGGIKQINANTVNFGATDAPLSDQQLQAQNLIQFPTVIGGIVVAFNVSGIKSNELVLDGKTLGDIFLGRITKWNDPAIVKLNPKLTLPEQSIAVVRRADGSGTTFVFSSYLAKVNAEWKEKVGAGATLNWPVGIAGKGNDGVAAFVQRLSGSIGYVEYTYAKKNGLASSNMISAQGEVVSPSTESFSNAAKDIDWQRSFAQDLTNAPGNNSWPITSATFILIHKTQADPQNGLEVVKFFDWAYNNGNKTAVELDYAPLPVAVVEQIRNTWKTQLTDSAGNKLYH